MPWPWPAHYAPGCATIWPAPWAHWPACWTWWPKPSLKAPDLEALDLARDCARDLSDRLRLLRAAWGSDSEMPDLATLLPGLPGAKRLRVDLAGLDAEEASVAQLGASLLLVAAGALPRGGAIRLAGGGRHLSLHLEGPKAAWPAGLEAGQPAEPGPRGVAVAMACLQAHALGWSIDVRSPVELTAG